MISARRAAREAALVVLFAVDAGKLTSAEVALSLVGERLRGDQELIEELFGDEDAPDEKLMGRVMSMFSAQGSQWVFVERLVHGAMDHRAAIDDLISKCSINWKLSRMGRVDRNVLRLATYELAFEPDVPGRVTLDEAIEMAKRYGTQDSGKFVNGILDRIAQQLEQV